LVRQSKFPWITSNLVTAAGTPFANLPRTAVLESGGLKIGFFGLTDAMETSSAGSSVRQLDLVAAACNAVKDLEARGVDAVIGMTQAPLELNQRILSACSEIDAILSEEREETASTVVFFGRRPVATPGGNLASVIRLDLSTAVDGTVDIKVSALPLDSTAEQDPHLKAFADSVMSQLDELLKQPVAYTERDLESGMYGDARARWRESNVGNLIADAFRDHYDADIGMIQGGGIRASVPAGRITRRDVLSLLPFNNRVVLIRLTGKMLLEALEHGVSAVEERSGRLLQVSGLQYSYDPSRPVGNRIRSVTIGGDPLRMDASYTVSMPTYLEAGGDGFTQFSRAEMLLDTEQAPIDAEVLEGYLRQREHVSPRLEGRIVRVESSTE
jgi:5'-nucleotidase